MHAKPPQSPVASADRDDDYETDDGALASIPHSNQWDNTYWQPEHESEADSIEQEDQHDSQSDSDHEPDSPPRHEEEDDSSYDDEQDEDRSSGDDDSEDIYEDDRFDPAKYALKHLV